ncbi:MAG: hypothetical protein M1837_005371 [Sclerophora amabilis]|nr:MAG: hypothetical protein M1837_005371 [Sclerophora amabilis]
MHLFEKYGMSPEHQKHRHLSAFLSIPSGHGHQSVWSFNTFLCTEVAEAPSSVLVDYGFLYCESARDRLELQGIYKSLLEKADPLDLHQACLQGKLFDFASKYIPINSRFRKIMKNMYPLSVP